ncbi:inositol-pentakisphosphate 2-kinase [Cryptococcus neoformans Tu401-1]|nr:inositol-pentakisphosphate 2-kinase [Cryptococcus neoformans var. grubii Bt85]OXG18735.1 inositol-pentakisphosphate 2-kinase [Cryptococcus neoformans var. grubii Tu401-1]
MNDGNHYRTATSPNPSADTQPSDWAYIAEGGAHIVFSYQGQSKTYATRALRVRKPSATTESLAQAEENDVSGQWRRNILPKLVPRQLLTTSREVTLEEGWYKELLAMVDVVRPAQRKSAIDLAAKGDRRGVLLEDLTSNVDDDGAITVAIEIKPKWGFLPCTGHLQPPESVSIKSHVSRFRLHQHFRGRADDPPYDPLDLFSGDKMRMRTALDGLWTMWEISRGKSNNWKVFIGSKEISPDDLQKGLLPVGGDDLVTNITQLTLSALQTSSALPLLKNLQQNLDPIDISSLAALFQAEHPNSPLFDPDLIAEVSAVELNNFVDIYISDPQAGQRMDSWSLRERIIAYALSAIFKDCSLFIRGVLKHAEDGAWRLVSGGESVKVIDLDLKPVKNIQKWAETDEKVWKHWLKTKGTR